MNRSKYNYLLVVNSLVLIIFGLIMVYSSSNVASVMRYGSHSSRFFWNQLIAVGIGIFAAVFIIAINKKWFKQLIKLALVASLVMLVLVLFFGKTVNNSRSWLGIRGFIFQPSEIFKASYILWISLYLDKYKDEIANNKKLIIPVLVVALGIFLIFKQPDVGTALIFAAIAFFSFLISPVSKKAKKNICIALFGIAAAALLLVVIKPDLLNNLSNKNRERLNLHGFCSHERFMYAGNQMCNSLIAFNNGGLLGKGLSKSNQKYLYLPDSHTDFIFPIIVEELGAIGGLVVILLIAFEVYLIIAIGKKSKSNFGAYICYLVAFLIFIYTFINIAGVSGLIPMTGVPLPFFSYGGTFMISLIALIACVLKVNIESNKVK